MSANEVRRFYLQVSSDPTLRERFRALSATFEGRRPSPEEIAAVVERDVLPLAREAGYDIGVGDLEAFHAAAAPLGLSQVTDDELAAVNGGFCCCPLIGAGGASVCGCAGLGFFNELFCFGVGAGE